MNLGNFIRERLFELEIDAAECARRSRGRISRAYVSQLKNHHAHNPTIDRLQGLSLGLAVPVCKLLLIALQKAPSPQTRFATLDAAYSELSPENQLRAEALIEVLEREFVRLSKAV